MKGKNSKHQKLFFDVTSKLVNLITTTKSPPLFRGDGISTSSLNFNLIAMVKCNSSLNTMVQNIKMRKPIHSDLKDVSCSKR
jgi:hypothetical protein